MVDVSSRIKVRKEWIFDDTFKESVLVIFDEWIVDYVANSGKKYDVIQLEIDGKDYLIMPNKIDYTAFVEKFGPITEKWAGQQAYMKKNAKGKYALYPIEEKVV